MHLKQLVDERTFDKRLLRDLETYDTSKGIISEWCQLYPRPQLWEAVVVSSNKSVLWITINTRYNGNGPFLSRHFR